MMLSWLTEAQAAGARLKPACDELGLDVRTVQRWRSSGGGEDQRHGPKTTASNKLTAAERQAVIDVANRPAFRDLSPKQIVPMLADSGRYLASESTFYRILREENLLHHRGRAKAPTSKPPQEHLATGPNQVWSWDITYLRSPVRGIFIYLYLYVDVWSRKIVGFRVADVESSELAAELLEDICAAQNVDTTTLVVHQDNGAPMKGASFKVTMEKLGITPSFSRPHVSDDNPFSEALFRTLKYRPSYPRGPFADIHAALLWVKRFIAWYNYRHLHSAIGFTTPASRHGGTADAILKKRRCLYARAQQQNPQRWTRATRAWSAPAIVRLNPKKATKAECREPLAA